MSCFDDVSYQVPDSLGILWIGSWKERNANESSHTSQHPIRYILHLYTMMLSPQAARMGTVLFLRKIGASSLRFKSLVPSKRNVLTNNARGFSTSTVGVRNHRSKSSLAQQEVEEDYPVIDRSLGHKGAVQARRSHNEPWMINLEREHDDWLHGPRPHDWFTGVHPKDCPGTIIR
jgi:hypothetical protein